MLCQLSDPNAFKGLKLAQDQYSIWAQAYNKGTFNLVGPSSVVILGFQTQS